MISILVPYRSDGGRRDELWAWVRKWWETNFPSAEICVGDDISEAFNRSAARNAAYRRARHDTLIIADADTVPTVTGVTSAIDTIQNSRRFKWALPYAQDRYYNLTRETTEAILSGDELVEPTEWEHKITSWAGCLILTRKAWETVGGYDERFIGWGGEDNAFQMALDTLVSPHIRTSSYICHLWHERGDADFSQPNWHHNRDLLARYRKANGVQAKMLNVLGMG